MRFIRFISPFMTGSLVLLIACSSPVEQSQITRQKSGESLYTDHQEKGHLSWAPDSNKIAYQTPRATLVLLQFSLSGDILDSLGILTVPYWNNEISSIELSPNNQRVVYQVSDSRFRLVSLVDSHTKSFSMPGLQFFSSLKWSLDGEELYAATRQNGNYFLSVVNVASDVTRAIALDSLDVFHAAHLFEDDQVLYTGAAKNNQHALWYKNADGRVIKIASDVAHDMTLFDASGVIIFTQVNDTNDIIIKKYSFADGTTTTLSRDFETVRLFKRIDDRQRLHFLGRHPALGSHLFSMSLTGEWQPLSDWLPPYFFSWSQDGQAIIQQDVSQKIYSAVHVLDLVEKKVIDLTPGSHFSMNETPVFTANSQNVIFSRNGRLVRIPATGGEMTMLSPVTAPPLFNPEVSPDGTLIACDDGENIFIVPVNGGEITNISRDVAISLANPTWSSDGEQMACEATASLEILKFDGQRLISEKAFPGQFQHIEWARTGASPFGEHIIFRKNAYGIATINTDTGERFDDFAFNADLISFCWAPNGREIAYTTPYAIVRSPLFTSLGR